MSAAVIIPAYNAADTIGSQLDAVLKQVPSEAEVCVVDNGSTDTTALQVDSRVAEHNNLRLIVATDRQNAGYARNVGVRATASPVVLFCDADDIVADGWYESMTTALKTYDMVGGFIEEDSLNDPEILAWRVKRDRERLVVAHGFLEHTIGANCGVSREMWEQTGGWPECLPSGAGEDVEFSWRVQLAGGSLGTVIASVVHYRHRTSIRGLARQYYRRAVNSHLICRVYRDQMGAAAASDQTGAETVPNPTPGPSTRVSAAAATLLALVPRLATDRRSQGALVRQAAYGLGWVAEEARYRAKGPGQPDAELASLLADVVEKRSTS